MSGLRPALIAGGYSGSTDCKIVAFDIHRVLSKNGVNFPFSVYDLIYRTLPDFAGGQAHGGERLLIFKGQIYLGQYDLDPPPYSDPIIIGDDILLKGSPRIDGNVIHLTRKELPPKVWLQGDVVEFVK
jgi:hypothetical protein